MIYDKFKSKIDKIAKVLRIIRKFRVPILAVLGLILTVIVTLLATKGIVSGDLNCPQNITYGEVLNLGSKAFMSDVCYEYCGEDGNWTTEVPNKPGTYLVRAAAKASFGGKRYGDVSQFTILPKEISVLVSDTALEYGEMPNLSAEFAFDDSATYGFEYYNLNTSSVLIEPTNVHVFNAVGVEVTDCYVITTVATPVELSARALTVETKTVSHVYDGTPFVSTEYEITENSVLDGDVMNVAFDGVSVLNAGEIEKNTASISFLNSKGIDVSNYYDVTKVEGYISVTHRPLYLETVTATKMYDGTPLLGGEPTVGGETSLATGQRFGEVVPAQITRAGKIVNIPQSVQIIDEFGNDVTLNYDIDYANNYILSVTNRPLSVSSQSQTKIYDGQLFVWEYADVDEGYKELGVGDMIEYHFSAEGVTNVADGVMENTFTVIIRNAAGEDVTDCYGDENAVIGYNYGTIQILPRAIKVKETKSYLDWVYDGLEHTDLYEYTNADLIYDNETYYPLVDGQCLVIKDAPKVTFVWDTPADGLENIIRFGVDNNGVDEFENGNYTIEIGKLGLLKMNKRAITLQTHTHEFYYNGEAQGCTGECMGIQSPIVSGSLGYGETLKIVWAESTIIEEKENKVDFAIEKEGYSGDKDLFENYEVTNLQNGRLIILGRPILVHTHDCEWTYDGLMHKDGDGLGNTCEYGTNEVIVDEANNYYGLLANHQLRLLTAKGEVTETIDFSYNESEVKVVEVLPTGEEVDVSQYYDISYSYGSLSIKARPITIKTASDAWTYDGDAHYNTDKEIVEGSLVLDHELRVLEYTIATVTNVADTYKANNTTEFGIYTANGVDKGYNYVINYEGYRGTLTINKRPITITTQSYSWIYDGESHSYTDKATGDNLVAKYEHSLYVEEDSVAWVRYVADTKENNNTTKYGIVDMYGVDVTDNYERSYNEGTLTIDYRPIYIVTRDIEFTYNGLNQHDETQYGKADTREIVENGIQYLLLPDTDYLEVKSYTELPALSVEKNPVRNVLTFDIYQKQADGSVKNVRENYSPMAFVYGDLTMKKADLTLTADSDEKTYDGTPLVVPTFTPPTWDNGHTITAVVEGSDNPNVGTYDNVIKEGSVVVMHPEHGDVTHCFNLTLEKGTLTINPRPITIKTGSGEWTYDGKAYSNTEKEIVAGKLVDGHELFLIEESVKYVTNVFDTALENNTTEFGVLDGNGEDVSTNYEITYRKGTLTINPRPIYIKATKPYVIDYDGEIHKDTYHYTQANDMIVGMVDGKEYFPLVDGHELKVVDATAVQFVWDTPDSGIENIVQFGVFNNGVDEFENGNYTIEIGEYGNLKMYKRTIYLQTHTHSWVYDAENHSCDEDCLKEESPIIYGSLGYGDYLTLPENLPTVCNATTTNVSNVFAYGIAKPDYYGDKDLRDNYEITYYSYGTLSVVKRTLVVKTTHDCMWYYDGSSHYEGDGKEYVNGSLEQGSKPYTNEDLYINEGSSFSLLEGHELVISSTYTISATSTSVGNYISLCVKTNGVENTNYQVHINDYGNLRIQKRTIVIKPVDKQAVYDGQTSLTTAYEYGEDSLELLSGHTFKITYLVNGYTATSKSITEPGTLTYTISHVLIYNGSSRVYDSSKSSNLYYDVQFSGSATLQMDKREIKVYASSASYMYDGTEKKLNADTYSSVEWLNGEGDALLSEHVLSVTTTGAKGVDARSYDNTITSHSITKNGVSMDKYYDVEYASGSLTISERLIRVSFAYKVVDYDGLEYSVGNNTYTNADTETGNILTGHTFSLTTESISGVKPGYYYTNVASWSVTDANGVDKTNNYQLINTEGDYLQINKLALTINTTGATKTYDGDPLTNSTTPTYSGLYNGAYATHRLTLKAVGSQTDAGSSLNAYEVVSFTVDGVSANLEEYYEITKNLGWLTVNKRPITVTRGSGTWVYDGADHSTPSGWIAYNSYRLVKDHQLYASKLDVVHYVWDSGTNDTEFGVVDGAGNDKTNNYSISYDASGTLTITPANLTIVAGSDYKTYDGTRLTCGRFITYGLDEMARQHSVSLSMTADSWILYVGTKENEIDEQSVIITDGINIVNECFYITCEKGELEILPILLTITSDSAEKEFDGTPLTNPKINYEGLLDGHSISGMFAIGSQTEVGESPNTLSGKPVLEGESGVTFKMIYTYVEAEGTLKVTGRETDQGFDMTGGLNGDGSGEGIGGEQDSKTMFYVKTEKDGVVYLRQESFGAYEYNGWSDTVKYYQDGNAYSPLEYVALSAQAYGLPATSLTVYSDVSAPYWLPYYATYEQGSDKNDVYAKVSWVNEYTISYYDFDYFDYANVLSSSNAGYALAEGNYAGFVRGEYMEIDTATKNELLSIMAKNGITADTEDLIGAVAKFIQNYRVYSFAVYGYDKNFALDFFNEDVQGGYCQHFATAGVMTYRAFGIPARYVGGYMVDAKAGETTEVTSDMAHAWVEVYIEGLGWIPVEVTGFAEGEGEGGAGNGGGSGEGGENGEGNEGEGGEGGENGDGGMGNGDLPFGLEITIKPIDVIKHWTEVQALGGILTHDGTIEEVLEEGSPSILERLAKMQYTWEATVEGYIEGFGTCTTTITAFTLYAPDGSIMYEYDAYNPIENEYENVTVIFETGTMTVTQGYLFDIALDSVTESYDGTEYSYIPDDADYEPYTYKIFGGDKSEVQLIFDKTKVPTLIKVGKVSEEDWIKCFTVLTADGSKDITSECMFRFTGGFEMEACLIVIEPKSWTLTYDELMEDYDGEFTCEEYAQPAGLAKGHKLEAVVFGSINDVGVAEVIIESWKVVDEKGTDVTSNYVAEEKKGTIIVTK